MTHPTLCKAPLLTTCVQLAAREVDALRATMDAARPVTFRTFARNCDWRGTARALGYSVGNCRDGGLTMEDDFQVRWYRSRWAGKPCYVMQHSAIEYIFQADRARALK